MIEPDDATTGDNNLGRAEATKRKLILAAEKLLGQRGFANVSQRMIQKEAGQRNAAVVTYHYKSFDDLLTDVFKLRMADINQRRLALFEDLKATDALDLRGVARVLIEPLVQELHPRPEGNHYVRFLLQYLTDQQFRRFSLPDSLAGGMYMARKVYDSLRADLPDDERDERRVLCFEMVVHALAVLEMTLEKLPEPQRQQRIDAKTRRLIDACVAILSQ